MIDFVVKMVADDAVPRGHILDYEMMVLYIDRLIDYYTGMLDGEVYLMVLY